MSINSIIKIDGLNFLLQLENHKKIGFKLLNLKLEQLKLKLFEFLLLVNILIILSNKINK